MQLMDTVRQIGSIWKIIIIFFIFTALFWGCPSNNSKRVEEFQKEEIDMVEDTLSVDYMIRIEEGGGFTGMVRGFSIYSDGRVQHWQHLPGQADSVLWTASGDTAKIDSFKTMLEEAGIMEKTYDQTGNVTTRLTFVEGTEKYSWSWPGIGEQGEAPVEIRDWYAEIKQYSISLTPGETR